ncbi:MAG: VCBS repeat-containing protein [Saprospiraceae bacterium]|nr:VCBS repeat-containing protein [Saprospiraceae bacterium]
MLRFYYIFILFLVACQTDKSNLSGENPSENSGSLYTLLNPEVTGVKFTNLLQEDNNYNYLNFEAIYNGAGVGVLDVNNDGLQDLFFSSNQGANKLFLNKGNFEFTDISNEAGIEGGKEFKAGVTIADVNGDGYDDIYVSCHLYDSVHLRRNKLYINNQNNTFTEKAKEFGIDDEGYSINATFFDYDLDGDLDLFVVNQPPNQSEIRNNIREINYDYSSKLYENKNGIFEDITKKAGVFSIGYSLSAVIADVSNDGWPDIYVTNDYTMPDFAYINNKDKTFVDITHQSFNHLSTFSMGCDIGDINNDGWLDIIVADMVAEDHYRNKANMAGMNPKLFWELVNSGLHHQYMFNTLHLNRGNGLFSDIAQLAGISKTDWSWSALFADYNNDGLQDLYITNGLKRDVRNRDFDLFRIDYFKNRNNPSYKGEKFDNATDLLDRAPSVKLANYMYQNTGDYHFKNVSGKWDLAQPSFSQGAAYADLDNDGDLDLVVNNMDENAFLYRNNSNPKTNHYLRIHCVGPEKNRKSFGARAIVYYGEEFQIRELSNSRGYLSCSEPVLHFGVGGVKKIDSLIVRWPGGSSLKMENVKVNQEITVDIKQAQIKMEHQILGFPVHQYTADEENILPKEASHFENEFDDYRKEILIPHKMSTLGPCLVVADINQDGLQDFYLGGSTGKGGKLFVQNNTGGFEILQGPWNKYKDLEDGDAAFEDIDKDGDLDLIIGTGSNEYPEGSQKYKTRLYINKGNGKFEDRSDLFPPTHISVGLVKVFDMDGDGDMDVFLGGRQVPGKYGMSAPSKILINDSGKFKDETLERCPQLNENFGMVSCGVYTDLNRDGHQDLVVAGEWMKITILINDGKGNFKDKSEEWGTDSSYGWWSSLVAVDIDKDGDPDLLAGNAGTNLKFKASPEKPFSVYLDDFDENGTWDTYLAKYDSDGKLYPIRGRQCSSEQMPYIKDKFKNYESFAKATVQEILEGKLEKSLHKFVNGFESGIFRNENKTALKFEAFPMECQFSPIHDFAVYDFNKDGKLDFTYAGNYYNREIETIRSDAGIGGICLGTSQNSFSSVHSSKCGFFLSGDTRKMKLIRINGADYLITSVNNGPVRLNRIL